MSTIPPIRTRDQAKARARLLRSEYAALNRPMSYSTALELIAKEQGYASWNVLSARLSNEPEVPLQVGDRVHGQFLKQVFDGAVIAVQKISSHSALDITIEFDEPVDVVTFKGFSNHRRRISARIGAGGVSFTRTSDGVPHLVVARDSAFCV
ncbi:glyoxalase superfamily protein [Parvularcula sp. LCG005]|uniref:glyoxalase superfamily protein n=1 Tax=Parvularcula sp. LCG005 TaxID=3078805 RepID=UPI0029430570|nr:glyoxalase superfamily protein [Parvularcula sp. LCG005]WOI53778.1 glyoxalase superfamily protein [Parvularcula sp. LCG005]